MKLERIVALVPMRHHSERVPGKNYRLLAGKPLYQHIINTLLACPEIDQVVVDTDSPIIMDGLAEQYPADIDHPAIVILERPEHLRAGTIPMNEVLLYDTSRVPGDLYVQTHSTNPLLRPQTVSRAIQALRAQFPTYDSLFGVTRMQVRLWDQLSRPVNHNPAILLRTQDLPPTFMENSCLYLFTRQNLEARRNRLGDRPLMFEIGSPEAWDIDDELNFSIADFLLSRDANSEGGEHLRGGH
jgi:CMP-N-acetylneuraminic acid synthetase